MSYMDTIVDNILTSHEERSGRLALIAQEISNLLKSFDKEHKDMACESRERALKLRESLDEFQSDLKKNGHTRHHAMQDEIQKRKRDLEAALNEFQRDLKNHEKNRYNTTQSEIKERKADLEETLGAFLNALNQQERDRCNATQSEMRERKGDLDNTLSAFQSMLKQSDGDRQKAFGVTHAGIKKELGDIQKNVRDVLAKAQELILDARKEQQEAAATWGKLAEEMRSGQEVGKKKAMKTEYKPAITQERHNAQFENHNESNEKMQEFSEAPMFHQEDKSSYGASFAHDTQKQKSKKKKKKKA